MNTRNIAAGMGAKPSASLSLIRALPPVVLTFLWLQACAPGRGPLPPSSQVSLLPEGEQSAAKPAAVEPGIGDETVIEGRRAPQPAEADSLVSKITPDTPPRRAASLRLTEEGRKLLETGEYAKALSRLEKTIAVDSTNPYGYYYLAKAHYDLGRYRESLSFLDVAESLLSREPYWLAEVLALKGENFRGLGFFQRADSHYSEALRLNPENRLAAEGLSRLREGALKPQR